MSFGSTASTIPKTKKLAGLDPSRVNSTQRAQPVPYFAAGTRLGVTWLGRALRQRAKKVGGGDDKSGGGDSHKYFADLAGLICHGPVDALTEVWMDDYRVWQGSVTRSPGQDSASVTIEDRGSMTIYWGTETQGIDPLLADDGHTAYRGQCYVVFNQLCLGTDTTNAPNVEFVLARQPQANVGALTQPPQVGTSANAVHCVVEILTNQRYGAALDFAALDLAALNVTAAQLAAEGVGLAPKIIDQASARETLTQFCEYIDGWMESFGDDLLRLRLTRSNQTATDLLPLLGEYDLLDVPEITPQGWAATANQVDVKFTNAEEGYQDDSVTWYDLANLACTATPRPNSLDRPWIDNKTLANKLAAYYGRLYSVPHLTAKLTMRKEAVATIQMGDFFRLTYRDFNETVIFRVTGRSMDKDRSQAVTLDVEANRYFDDILAYIPEHAPAGDVLPIEPEPVLFGRVIELPFDLAPSSADRNAPQLAAVGARASALDIKLKVFGSEDGLTYDRLAATRDFALYATLATDYSGGTLLLDANDDGLLLNVAGPDIDFPTTSVGGWIKNRLLLFIDDEILSYRDAVVVGANQVRLRGIKRACADTLPADHAAGADVLMIARKELCVFTDASYAKGLDTELKLATATQRGTLDLSVLEPIALTLTNRTARPLPPINLRVNGAGAAPTYATDQDVTIRWDEASWRRHDFFTSWDEAFSDPKLFHKLRIAAADGTVKRKVNLDPGVHVYAYTQADLAADFGSAPASFRVQVFSRRRGFRSLRYLEQVVNRDAQPAVNPPSRTNWMYPSLMSQVLGACDPQSLVDRNFALCADHFGLDLPATAVADEDGAPTAIQTNFTTLETALNLTLYPVAASRNPEVATQANFEIINAAW